MQHAHVTLIIHVQYTYLKPSCRLLLTSLDLLEVHGCSRRNTQVIPLHDHHFVIVICQNAAYKVAIV